MGWISFGPIHSNGNHNLYEEFYFKIDDITQISYNNAANSIWPLYTRLFKTDVSIPGQDFETLKVIPFNYEELRGSQHYKGLASWWRHSRVVGIEVRMDALQQHESILDQIEDELE